MSQTKERTSISPQPRVLVQTRAGTLSSASENAYEQWQQIIEGKLWVWQMFPSVIEDDGVEPVSGEAVKQAIHWAERMKKEGAPAPDKVVPDPNGGIVFERRERNSSEIFHFDETGGMEYRRFEGTKLIERLLG